jgi:hypothetical protein
MPADKATVVPLSIAHDFAHFARAPPATAIEQAGAPRRRFAAASVITAT